MVNKRLTSEKDQRELIISATACTLIIFPLDLLSPVEGELISC